MTFIGDKFLRLRQFFETWQNLVIDPVTNNTGYYDDFVAPVDIFQLGSFDTLNDRDSATYGVRMFECYPTAIGTVDYNYGTKNDYVKINVTFTYRYWLNFNLDIDSTGKVGGLSSGEVKLLVSRSCVLSKTIDLNLKEQVEMRLITLNVLYQLVKYLVAKYSHHLRFKIRMNNYGLINLTLTNKRLNWKSHRQMRL